jgi:hypothetical protein
MKMRRCAWQAFGVVVVTLVVAAPGMGAAIIHRYSFTADAKDSVGGADGMLMGNAAIADGQLMLDGSAGTYVDLGPIGNDISGLTNSTFEVWVTWQESLNRQWERIFDFGMDTTNNMFLTPHPNAHGPRFSLTTNGGGDEQQVETAMPFPVGVETHLAITIDADNQVASMYINGQIAGAVYFYTNTPSLLGATANNYLGKSQYADPYFNGSINEFRVYNTALSAAQIATNFANGPDGTPP